MIQEQKKSKRCLFGVGDIALSSCYHIIIVEYCRWWNRPKIERWSESANKNTDRGKRKGSMNTEWSNTVSIHDFIEYGFFERGASSMPIKEAWKYSLESQGGTAESKYQSESNIFCASFWRRRKISSWRQKNKSFRLVFKYTNRSQMVGVFIHLLSAILTMLIFCNFSRKYCQRNRLGRIWF